MYETIIHDLKKQKELDAEIDDIINKIKTFSEAGWTLIKLNRLSRLAIIPLSCAIRDRLAELEELVLGYGDATSDPDLRAKIKWQRSVSAKKANQS